jgi:hypothetical protein
MQSSAPTVKAYLESLPDDRRAAISKVRAVINENLPAGYQEGMQFGMIGWCIPLSRYPDTYNGQPLGIAALASQKNAMSLYLNGVYGDRELERWFKDAFAKAGKKLDMGKSCVRFKRLEDLPLDVIAETISRVSVEKLIEVYEASRRQGAASSRPRRPPPDRRSPPASRQGKRRTRPDRSGRARRG